jgi:hypothetical protein
MEEVMRGYVDQRTNLIGLRFRLDHAHTDVQVQLGFLSEFDQATDVFPAMRAAFR